MSKWGRGVFDGIGKNQYNRRRKKVLPVTVSPKVKLIKEIRLTLEPRGGFPYAFNTMISTTKTIRNANKSYGVIRIAPFRG